MEVEFGDDTQVCHDFYAKFHITETLLDEISKKWISRKFQIGGKFINPRKIIKAIPAQKNLKYWYKIC